MSGIIVDWERKGNLIRLHLGAANLKEWYGDDWDDAPYEYNAGVVYPEFETDVLDVAIPYDMIVKEPRDDTMNSGWSKNDMRARRTPMFIIANQPEGWGGGDFQHLLADDNATRIYMGDDPTSVFLLPGVVRI